MGSGKTRLVVEPIDEGNIHSSESVGDLNTNEEGPGMTSELITLVMISRTVLIPVNLEL